MIEFAVTDDADQGFAALINDRRVSLRLRYNPTSARWNLDLSIDDLPVLHGRRIVTGVDLLAPFDFGIGVVFAFAVTPGSAADRDALPSGRVRLYHTTEAEIAEALA